MDRRAVDKIKEDNSDFFRNWPFWPLQSGYFLNLFTSFISSAAHVRIHTHTSGNITILSMYSTIGSSLQVAAKQSDIIFVRMSYGDSHELLKYK